MKTQVFTGELFEQKVTRKIVTKDPATGRDISKLAKYDMVTGLVIDRVTGMGPSDTPNKELQITLSGQFKPFGTLRITASAQNYEKVVNALKGNVERSEGQELPFLLKNEIVVTAVGNLMKGRGMNVAELYISEADGSVKTIIGAPESATETTGIDQVFL